MVTSRVKSTYSMDVETARLLENLAQRWRVEGLATANPADFRRLGNALTLVDA
jgi:hypothetical protein